MRSAILLLVAVAAASLGLGGTDTVLLQDGGRVPASDVQHSAAWWQARDAASIRAWQALTALRDAGGADDWRLEVARFSAADGPPAFDQLTAGWTIQLETIQLERQTISAQAGGLVDGRPKDISDLVSHLGALVAQADGDGLESTPGPDALTTAAGYWGLDISAQLEQHDTLRARLQNAFDILTNRLYARSHAQDLAADLDRLVQIAGGSGIPADVMAEVRDAKSMAAAPHSEAEAYAAMAKAQAATDALNQIIYAAAIAPPPMPPCLDGKPAGQIIVIHLDAQVLYAFQDGCPILATKVTTGRAALPTPPGTYSIFYKAPAYKMVSPWPLGSPFWYPTTWVYDAMEFIGDGTFIHSADWQPVDTYGAGSQYGPFSSHGCVHVQDAPLAVLYAWAQIGTTVIVQS